MIRKSLLLAGVMALALGCGAAAQEPAAESDVDPLATACLGEGGEAIEARLAACTEIANTFEAPADRTWGLQMRAGIQRDMGLSDRALADASKSIRLDPGGAFG